MAATGRNHPGEPGHPGLPGGHGEPTGRGGEGGSGGAGGRGGGDSGEPGGRGGEGGPGGAGRSYGRSDKVSRWFDRSMRIAVVISIVGNAVLGTKVWNDSRCQARFNERATALAPALNKERDTQRAADDAADRLVLGLGAGDSPAQRQQFQASLRAWQAAITARKGAQVEADKARAAHPLPTCGGTG